MIFSLEEVNEATANFDETRKIGEGGFGSVYFGMIGNQVMEFNFHLESSVTNQ